VELPGSAEAASAANTSPRRRRGKGRRNAAIEAPVAVSHPSDATPAGPAKEGPKAPLADDLSLISPDAEVIDFLDKWDSPGFFEDDDDIFSNESQEASGTGKGDGRTANLHNLNLNRVLKSPLARILLIFSFIVVLVCIVIRI
jgi:hypothetical protein